VGRGEVSCASFFVELKSLSSSYRISIGCVGGQRLQYDERAHCCRTCELGDIMATFTGLDGLINGLTGTIGKDTFYGGANGAYNIFYGDSDGLISAVIRGIKGNDTFFGGANSTNLFHGDAEELTGTAIGGNDKLSGGINSDNYLIGDAWQLSGSATGGNDTLNGGANSTNQIHGDANLMRHSATGGSDTLIGGKNSTNNLYGDCWLEMYDNAAGGNDTLKGGANSTNLLYGDAGTWLQDSTTGGDDTLIGGADSTNYLAGDANHLLQNASGGNDTLIGGANSTNYLYGDARGQLDYNVLCGNDTLIGGTGGVNYLYGDADYTFEGTGGDDRLVSAVNTTDHMWGDVRQDDSAGLFFVRGNDTFAFRQSNGNDFIYDFHQGEDIIELGGFYELANNAGARLPAKVPSKALGQLTQSFSDLNIQEVDANGDSTLDSVIHFDASNSVTVIGVTGLTATDFSFVA
jgi:hypothetical protein